MRLGTTVMKAHGYAVVAQGQGLARGGRCAHTCSSLSVRHLTHQARGHANEGFEQVWAWDLSISRCKNTTTGYAQGCVHIPKFSALKALSTSSRACVGCTQLRFLRDQIRLWRSTVFCRCGVGHVVTAVCLWLYVTPQSVSPVSCTQVAMLCNTCMIAAARASIHLEAQLR